ncbi:MAG: riboflavin biosynthesis protein RibF [Muribaculaceae bacterium]|nr:riboflavin biosynthesis protein RibF [Muribaculaceae bacterium]
MRRAVAAIGTFDGVHKGHITVVDKLKEIAAEKDVDPIVITFDNHPLTVIAPERIPSSITTTEKKCELLRGAGVMALVMHFDNEMRETTARDWMRRLRDDYGVVGLVVGYDNTFGSDGVTHSIADYKRIGAELGIEVVEAPFVAGISSSAIRKAIIAGDIDHATSMLGRYYSISGTVVTGNRLGRTIGFPTANLLPHPELTIPANGVYAAIAVLPDGSRRQAIVNIGTRPTVRRGDQRTVEAHIIDFDGDLYGQSISLVFRKRLRNEMKFKSIEALRQQIEKDRDAAKVFLSDATKSGK